MKTKAREILEALDRGEITVDEAAAMYGSFE